MKVLRSKPPGIVMIDGPYSGHKIIWTEDEVVPDDKVNHPKHYTSHPSGVECITITEHYNFCVGNAIKYLWRAGLKEEISLEGKEKEIQDLEKAIWYIQRQIQNLQK